MIYAHNWVRTSSHYHIELSATFIKFSRNLNCSYKQYESCVKMNINSTHKNINMWVLTTHENIFLFLFGIKKLKSFYDNNIKLSSKHLETYPNYDSSDDLDSNILFKKLK